MRHLEDIVSILEELGVILPPVTIPVVFQRGNVAGVRRQTGTGILPSIGFALQVTCPIPTGEVVGLFAKDEKDAMCGDVRNDFVKDNPNMEEREAILRP